VCISGESSFSGVRSVEDWWAWSEGPLLHLLSASDHQSLVCINTNDIVCHVILWKICCSDFN